MSRGVGGAPPPSLPLGTTLVSRCTFSDQAAAAYIAAACRGGMVPASAPGATFCPVTAPPNPYLPPPAAYTRYSQPHHCQDRPMRLPSPSLSPGQAASKPAR